MFLFLAVGNNMSEGTKTMVAMETQPAVEPVKAEVSPDKGRRAETAEARVETRDVEGRECTKDFFRMKIKRHRAGIR